MLNRSERKHLADDFELWGLSRVRRIQKLTRQYGVLCSGARFSDGKRG